MGGFKKGIWIARDQNGELYAYIVKPKVYTDPNTKVSEFVTNDGGSVMNLPPTWYKNVKFKNSPVFIPIPEQLVEQQIK
jgi:hypothetical protein